MAHRVDIDRERGFCRITLFDEVEGAELIAAICAMLEHPAWRPGTNTLWDALGIRALAVDPETVARIQALMHQYAARRGPGRTAFLVKRDLDRSMALLFKVLLDLPGREIQVFTSPREALSWLGMDALPVSSGG